MWPIPVPPFRRSLCEHAFVSRDGESWVERAGRPPSATRTRPVEERLCRHHGWTEFANYAPRTDGNRWRCKRCVGEAVRRRHHKVRRILIAEAGGCCALCGYDGCVINLHFHHVDPETKAFNMSMAAGKSEAAYRAEMAKCVLVCANCHGEIESGMTPSPPAGARYGERWPESPPQVPATEAAVGTATFTQLGLAEAGGDAGAPAPSRATARSGTARGRSRASRRR